MAKKTESSKKSNLLELVDYKLPLITKCGETGSLLSVVVKKGDPVKLTVLIKNLGDYCTVDVDGSVYGEDDKIPELYATAQPGSTGTGTFTLKKAGTYILRWQCHSSSEEGKDCAARIRVYQHL